MKIKYCFLDNKKEGVLLLLLTNKSSKSILQENPDLSGFSKIEPVNNSILDISSNYSLMRPYNFDEEILYVDETGRFIYDADYLSKYISETSPLIFDRKLQEFANIHINKFNFMEPCNFEDFRFELSKYSSPSLVGYDTANNEYHELTVTRNKDRYPIKNNLPKFLFTPESSFVSNMLHVLLQQNNGLIYFRDLDNGGYMIETSKDRPFSDLKELERSMIKLGAKFI